jgi:soluble lytic murein transglycosylase-like protein
MKPEELMLLGESLRSHRHYDRAVDVLNRALARLPSRRDDLLFALGRAHFGAERYAEAEKLYLKGAAETKASDVKATFFYHASRAAQLVGDDTRAEQHMDQAIKAVGPVNAAPKPKPRSKRRTARPASRAKAPPVARAGPPSPITAVSPGAAALVQRLRTRLAQKRFEDAEADLRYGLQRFPESAAEATLAYAVALVAAGRTAPALAALQALPRPSDRFVASEVDYWQARAHESAGDAGLALGEFLLVLRAAVPTHFAYFARRRLADPPLAARLAEDLKARREDVDRRIAAGDFDGARTVQTDVVLLAIDAERSREVEKLRSIYEKLPRYREVLELRPWDFPRFPLPGPGAPEDAPASPPAPAAEPTRLDLLLAMGLFDDAVDLVPDRWALSPPSVALTRSLALHLGAAPRGSIYAAEVLMRAVPDDFVPELLPRVLRELLYPRYFYDLIVAEAKKHGADPRLVLSVMREESRFDPRAKSAASARGLLQFIIATARDVGRTLGLMDLETEDLYDPAVVIQLGAKYVADLAKQFEGDPYRTAAAYNAGPYQVKLWWRLAAEPRPDAFFSAVSFDETKNYVRKVLNSYERYAEIYDQAGPAGGLRIEP